MDYYSIKKLKRIQTRLLGISGDVSGLVAIAEVEQTDQEEVNRLLSIITSLNNASNKADSLLFAHGVE